MSFLDVWNPAYEGSPADTENINLGAGRIRDFKINVRERLNVDHSFGDAFDNGRHLQVTLMNAGGVPATRLADEGLLWANAVAGNTELLYQDSTGRIVQITLDGSVNAPSPFASGTVMLFAQASPPSGWVQTSNNDAMVRLVNDASGGSTGGSWTIGGTSLTLSAGSLSVSSSFSGSVSGTVAGHTLAVGELPSHTHDTILPISGGSNGGSAPGGENAVWSLGTPYQTDGGTGGGGSHTHGWSGSVSGTVTSTPTQGNPTGTFSNDGTWRPSYVNAMLAVKS